MAAVHTMEATTGAGPSLACYDELKDLLVTRFEVPASVLDADRPLIEYGLDSLALAELMYLVEEHMGVEFPDSRLDIDTLRGLSAAIDGLRMRRAA